MTNEKTQLKQQQLIEKLNLQTVELKKKFGTVFRADEYHFQGMGLIKNKGSLEGLHPLDFIDQNTLELQRQAPTEVQKEEWLKLQGTEPETGISHRQLGEKLQNLRQKFKDPQALAKQQQKEKLERQIRMREAANNASLKG